MLEKFKISIMIPIHMKRNGGGRIIREISSKGSSSRAAINFMETILINCTKTPCRINKGS